MMNTTSIYVPHLGGIDAAYQMPKPYDASKPVVVLVNSFTTSSELYRTQFRDEKLTASMNLIAIEPLGHGKTRARSDHWTYWDTAIMNLQVLQALGMIDKGKKVFVLGTSQGGWISARMALLAPEQTGGILLLGTSMDYESERSRKLGCWDGPRDMADLIDIVTSTDLTPTFELDSSYSDYLIKTSFGPMSEESRSFWEQTIKSNYSGDDGRRRLRMAAINLCERDGLYGRLFDVRCPVLWLHGTADNVYSVANAQEEVKLFVNSPDVKLQVVDGGYHFLSFSSPENVRSALLGFVDKYGR